MEKLNMTATKAEFEKYLREADLTSYQHIDLPFGLALPGKDHSKKIEAVYRIDLNQKKVLDIGCYYGLYSHEAVRRGAQSAVGVEINPDRYQAAKTLAKLMDDNVEIVNGDIMNVDLDEQFDIVLFLSVLHHVLDPIAVMKRLAELSTEYVIVEFCSITHRLNRKKEADLRQKSRAEILFANLKRWQRTFLLNKLNKTMGIILTGGLNAEDRRGYDWTFFFNKKAFHDMFVVQNKFFSSIEFIPSPGKKDRIIAFCKKHT
jgi:2-polyprenyl-3-methyl-5-hydroxy-6-metoxy-1,4-benzoquinol methylase